MNVCTKFHCNPSKSCWDILVKATNVNLMVMLEEPQKSLWHIILETWMPKLFFLPFHPVIPMEMWKIWPSWTKFHGNPSSWSKSVWTKVVDWPACITILRATLLAWLIESIFFKQWTVSCNPKHILMFQSANTGLTSTPGASSKPTIPFIASWRQVLFQFSTTGNCLLTDRQL